MHPTDEEAKKEILNLSSKKVTRIDDIRAKVLKTNTNIYLKDLTALVNDCLEKGVFRDELELADVSPVFKKDENLDKENYRPVSILSHMSSCQRFLKESSTRKSTIS